MPEGVRRLAGDRVRAVGYVEDVRQFLESCRLTVAPLRYGAGIKGKVATSLSHGVPVVASSIAIEGMGCEHGIHALVADSVAEWVDAVAMAYTDKELWQRLSENGLDFMRELYSLEAGKSDCNPILEALGSPLSITLSKSRMVTR